MGDDLKRDLHPVVAFMRLLLIIADVLYAILFAAGFYMKRAGGDFGQNGSELWAYVVKIILPMIFVNVRYLICKRIYRERAF